MTCMDEFRCGMQTLVSHCPNTWSTKRELGLFIFLCQTQKCLLVEVMTALSNCGISARHAFFYAFNSKSLLRHTPPFQNYSCFNNLVLFQNYGGFRNPIVILVPLFISTKALNFTKVLR